MDRDTDKDTDRERNGRGPEQNRQGCKWTGAGTKTDRDMCANETRTGIQMDRDRDSIGRTGTQMDLTGTQTGTQTDSDRDTITQEHKWTGTQTDKDIDMEELFQIYVA